MAYFAKVVNGLVTTVIVAEQSFFDKFVDSSPGTWVETFMDGSQRKNYAGIGYSYDSNRDAFISQKPYSSWILDESTCKWNPPTPYPSEVGTYVWDESTVSWKSLT